MLWLRPGYQHQLPHLTNTAHLHAALELLSGDDSVRAAVTRSRLDRMLTLTDQLADLRIQIDALVKASGSTLPEIYGVGPVVAARYRRPRLLPAQTSRRQDQPRSPPLPQKTAL